MSELITVLDEEMKGWAACALAAYKAGLNKLGHQMSLASNLPHGFQMDRARHKRLMTIYRHWRTTGEFPPPPEPRKRIAPRERPHGRKQNPAYPAGRGRWGIFLQHGKHFLQFDGREFSLKDPEKFETAQAARTRIRQLRNRYPQLRKMEFIVDVIQ